MPPDDENNVVSAHAGATTQAGNNEFRLNQTEARINSVEEKITEFKIKTIEILAIFVALFTFVSVDIQIFKSEISFYTAIGFSLIMLGSLLLFILTLYVFIDLSAHQNKSKLIVGFIFMVVLVASGISIATIDYHGYTKEIREAFYSRDELKQLVTEHQKSQKIIDCLLILGYFNAKCLK